MSILDEGLAQAAEQPCDCLAYDPDHNDHTGAQHTMCEDARECGGCDNCIDMAMSAAVGAA